MTNSNQINIKSETSYVSYIRVSTKGQGDSGLGMESQKAQIDSYLSGSNGILLASFSEIESGKKSNRIELEKAIALCKKSGATLIIAKLDRLSRDVEFLFNLKNSGIQIKSLDIPDFNTLTLGIFATIAQHERELISTRTKNALNELKKQGIKLGSPCASETMKEVQSLGVEKIKEKASNNTNNIKAKAMIKSLLTQNKSFREIAKELNASGFLTSKGFEFTHKQVARLAS